MNKYSSSIKIFDDWNKTRRLFTKTFWYWNTYFNGLSPKNVISKLTNWFWLSVDLSNAFGAVWENGLETPGIASGSASMSTKIMDPLYQRKKKALVVIHAVSKTKKTLKLMRLIADKVCGVTAKVIWNLFPPDYIMEYFALIILFNLIQAYGL